VLIGADLDTAALAAALQAAALVETA